MSFFSTQKIKQFSKRSIKSNNESAPLPIDIHDQDGRMVIIAPIAGVTMDDINVSLTDDILTIKGERKVPKDLSDVNTLSKECHWGEFSRSIVLPVKVNTQKVAAFYKQGILRIEMPIIARESTRVIPIAIEQ